MWKDTLRIILIFKREVWLFAHRLMFLFCTIISVICPHFHNAYERFVCLRTLPTGSVDEDLSPESLLRRPSMLRRAERSWPIIPIFTEARRYEEARFTLSTTFHAVRPKAEANKQLTISVLHQRGLPCLERCWWRSWEPCGELASGTFYVRLYMPKGSLKIRRWLSLAPRRRRTPCWTTLPLNYSVYLNNNSSARYSDPPDTLTTTYTIGYGMETRNTKGVVPWLLETPWWLFDRETAAADQILSTITTLYDVVFFNHLQFPCNCGIWGWSFWDHDAGSFSASSCSGFSRDATGDAPLRSVGNPMFHWQVLLSGYGHEPCDDAGAGLSFPCCVTTIIDLRQSGAGREPRSST